MIQKKILIPLAEKPDGLPMLMWKYGEVLIVVYLVCLFCVATLIVSLLS